jgi:hypothetical protein
LLRFKRWAGETVGPNAKFITRLTLEGRHFHEEGVVFVADIDVHKDEPFKLDVRAEDQVDGALVDVRTRLERDLVHTLWEMSGQGQRRGIVFTSERICLLGQVFVKAMHRAGEMEDADVWLGPGVSTRF